MIHVMYRIPSYNMTCFEELMKIESIDMLNLPKRIKLSAKKGFVEWLFLDELGNELIHFDL